MSLSEVSRLTIYISPELHRQFKARCASDGVSMSQCVYHLINKHLTSQTSYATDETWNTHGQAGPSGNSEENST